MEFILNADDNPAAHPTQRMAESNVDLPSDYGRCSLLLKGEILQSEP